MPLGPRASAGDWIRDFRQSSAPQFRGKSGAERQRMALGAYYGNRRAAGGLTDDVFRMQGGGGLFGSTDSNLFNPGSTSSGSTAGVDYSPGGMPAGGYNNPTNPNYGQFSSIYAPGNMPAGGTGFPITPAPLPEGSQVGAPNPAGGEAAFGAGYGVTPGYTYQDPYANDPLARIYGRSSNPWSSSAGPIKLSNADMQAFLAAPSFHGDPNNPEDVIAYRNQFPAAVQDQMMTGGRLWNKWANPSWNPSSGWKGVFTSDLPDYGGSTRGGPPTAGEIQRAQQTMQMLGSSPNLDYMQGGMPAGQYNAKMLGEHFNKIHNGNYLSGYGINRYWAPGEQAAFNRNRQQQGHAALNAVLQDARSKNDILAGKYDPASLQRLNQARATHNSNSGGAAQAMWNAMHPQTPVTPQMITPSVQLLSANAQNLPGGFAGMSNIYGVTPAQAAAQQGVTLRRGGLVNPRRLKRGGLTAGLC